MANTEHDVVDKFQQVYTVLVSGEVQAWLASKHSLPREDISKLFREAEKGLLIAECTEAGVDGDEDAITAPIPQLSELFSELTWRVVNGTLPAETAVNYLASDVPFENKLSPAGRATAAVEAEKKEESGEKTESSTGGSVDMAARVTQGEREMELQARSIVECLCDTLWGVEAMVRGTVTVNFLERLADNREWGRLCTLVSQLREIGIVSDDRLLSLLPEELLVGARIIDPPVVRAGKKSTVLRKMLLKKNTELVYKQHRFNLQREETEGFAKLVVLLGGVKDQNAAESEENMRRLIGYFDLDPNRSLDLTLDALEAALHEKASHRGLLRLVGNFKQESLPDVVGFKLRHYRDPFVAKYHRAKMREALDRKELDPARYKEELHKITPRSLYVLCAVLLSTGTMTLEGILPHLSPGLLSLSAAEKAYMNDLEKQLATSGSRIVVLDEDGNISTAAGGVSDSSSKLGSMAPLAAGSGYGGGFHGHNPHRDSRERDGGRDRDGRRRSGDSVKANGTSSGGGAGGGGGDEDDDVAAAGGATKDNQMFGVLEALLDIRAWKVASQLLDTLKAQGIDPLRNRAVREALKRLVKDALHKLANRCPLPITLRPAGSKGIKAIPPTVATSLPAKTPTVPKTATVAKTPAMGDDVEAGEVLPQQALGKMPSFHTNGSAPSAASKLAPAKASTSASSSALAASSASALGPGVSTNVPYQNYLQTEDLTRLPGYGNGFVVPDKLKDAVAVLGPLLKTLGPHIGRDPVMFARVCRVLSAVAAKNRGGRGDLSNSNTSTSGKENNSGANNGASASTNSNSKDTSKATPTLSTITADPLKSIRCLFGLSYAEALDIHRQQPGGPAALKKEIDTRKMDYIKVVLSVAPALGMTHGNPAMQAEVWTMLSELDYEDRYLLYGAWRGHNMEKYGLRSKHPQLVVAETASGAEISRLIKMLTSDNVRDMAFKLGKASHAHPLVFAEKILNQLESYDNFITMIADSLRYVSNSLGLDCVAYTMVQHLCQSNRSIVTDSGLTLERWITNLATFAGLLYRKHCDTDVKGLLSWSVRALAEGGEPAMAAGKVLREVLHQAGGVQVLDGWSITQAQVDGKGGGDVLRQENASFGATVKPVKKAQKMLQDGMDKAGAAVPLVILPAHQTEALLYEGGSMDDQMRGRPQPHLKVLGHRSDETHTTMLQASEFVCSSKAWIKAKCPSLVALIKTYKLEPRVAFHIWRPIINDNLMKHWFGKTKKEVEEKVETLPDRFIKALEDDITTLIPDSNPLTSKLLVVFWALSLSDVYVPTKRYAAVVSNMQDAKSRAKSKLHEDVNATEKLNKAERIQYETDLKRCDPMVSSLEKEKAEQMAHVKRVKSKLREIKGDLFRKSEQPDRAESVRAVLKSLVAPRIGMGPEEAYFCSKFFNTLHAIEAPDFNSLLFYEKSFLCLSPTLLCKTQYEAASLGFFLKDLLENVKEWRKSGNEAIFKMEAATKHGFNLQPNAAGNTDGKAKGPQVAQKHFVEASATWSMQVTKTLLAALTSDEFLLIKCGLIMFSKIVESCPLSQAERKMLLAKLEPMTDKANEPRDDIRVPCTGVVTQLKKQIAEAGPDPDAPKPTPQGQNKTTAASSGSSKANAATPKTSTPSAVATTASTAKPSGRTVEGLNRSNSSKSVGSTGSKTSLSPSAAPFVPSKPTTTSKPSQSVSKSATPTNATSQSSAAVKKEPSVSSPPASNKTAASKASPGAAAVSQSGQAGGGSASKRSRDSASPTSQQVTRPTKTQRVDGKGGGSTVGGASGGGTSAGSSSSTAQESKRTAASSSSSGSKSSSQKTSSSSVPGSGNGTLSTTAVASAKTPIATSRTSGRSGQTSTSSRTPAAKGDRRDGGGATQGQAQQSSGGSGAVRNSRERGSRGSDADSRAKTLATKDMERGTGSLTGTGTLAVSHPSSKREVVITTSRRSSRDDPNVRVSGSGGSMGGSSRGGGYADDNNGRSPRMNDDEQRSRTSRSGGGRTVERTGSGGGSTSSRAKRGRSVDSDRGGGGDVGGYAEDYFEEGDPSQAFDSKRMRPADAMQMPVEEGPSRSSVDAGWSRGYGDEAARPRSYGGGGGGGGSRMQMSQRDIHKDRSPMYDGHGRGGGSGGGVMEGGGYHDDDTRGSSRKGGRHDRDRSSNRSEEDGDGGRKDKKKSKKSRSSKDKRRN